MTLMILFLSEIVPETIGAAYWRILAGPTSIFIKSLIVSLYQIVWLSERVTQFISSKKDPHIVNGDEFIAMTSVGVKTVQLDIKESSMIHNLLRFESLRFADIMTPRTVISAIAQDMKISDSLKP